MSQLHTQFGGRRDLCARIIGPPGERVYWFPGEYHKWARWSLRNFSICSVGVNKPEFICKGIECPPAHSCCVQRVILAGTQLNLFPTIPWHLQDKPHSKSLCISSTCILSTKIVIKLTDINADLYPLRVFVIM